jgi:hypothetical protein
MADSHPSRRSHLNAKGPRAKARGPFNVLATHAPREISYNRWWNHMMGTRGMNRRAASVHRTSCTLVHHYDGQFRLDLSDQIVALLERFPSRFESPTLKLIELTLDQ